MRTKESKDFPTSQLRDFKTSEPQNLRASRLLGFLARQGQTALALTLLMGGIVLLIGVTLAILAISFLNSSAGYRSAQLAQGIAASGIYDAMLQLERNKDFSNTSGYTLSVGSSTATVTVTQNSPLTNEVTIVSNVSLSSFTKAQQSIQAVVSRDSNTGQIGILSWTSALPPAVVAASTAGVGSWTTATTLPNVLNTHSATAYNGYVYVTGGLDHATSISTSTVYFASVSGGAPGAWTKTVALPGPISSHSAAVNNGYIYTTGGLDTGSVITSSVFYAFLNSTGSISNWSSTKSLPSAIDGHFAVVYNGYIYTIEGIDASGNVTTTVFYAFLNSTGSISNWSSTTQLPGATDGSAFAYNGYIYATGGSDPNSPPNSTTTVYYAPINSTGSLGAWSTTTALPSAIAKHTAIPRSGYVYTIGGYGNGFSVTSTVFYAQINGDGTIGAWNTTTKLPSANFGSAATYNGYVYETGGQNASFAVTSTVFYAQFNN